VVVSKYAVLNGPSIQAQPLTVVFVVCCLRLLFSVVLLELLCFTWLRYLFLFIINLYFILITCTAAFPAIGNTVVLLELLRSTRLSISYYRSSITDNSIHKLLSGYENLEDVGRM
jgi:hypothetical protein